MNEENINNHDEKVMYMLGQISSDVKGINSRLDKVNGRLDRHDDSISSLEKNDSARSARSSIIGALIGFVSGTLSGFLSTKL